MMQRILMMMRHAKTNAEDPGQTDFDRTLTIRGLRNATEMGEQLKSHNLVPDVIIASPARRTRQTAESVAESLGYDKDKIIWVRKLYHCDPSTFEDVVYELDIEIKKVLIVAHNPGITEFVNSMTPGFEIDNMVTGAISATYVDADQWTDFSVAAKQVFLYISPKKDL